MNHAKRAKHPQNETKHADPRSGVFELPASARVVRRGSTRIEAAASVEGEWNGRGRDQKMKKPEACPR